MKDTFNTFETQLSESMERVDEIGTSVHSYLGDFKEGVTSEWNRFVKDSKPMLEKLTKIKFEHGKVTGYPHGFGTGRYADKWLSSIEFINKEIPIYIYIGWDITLSGTSQEVTIHTPDGKNTVSMEVGTTLDSVRYIQSELKNYMGAGKR